MIKLYTNPCTKEEESKPLIYEDIKFPYYPSNVKSVVPMGLVSLADFLNKHAFPHEKILKVFESIEIATKRGNTERKDWLKQNKLFFFTPTVDCNYRSYANIKSFNPIMVAEYDKVGLNKAEWLKRAIFERFDSCICAYLSPSRTGVKFLFRIPIVKSVKEYKEYFYGLAYYLSQIEGFDESNRNPTLPLFLSHDESLLYRKQAEVKEWRIRGFKTTAFPIEPPDDFEKPSFIPKWKIEKAKETIKNVVNKSDLEQIGHPNVIAAALLAGGYASGGILDNYEALYTLENAINTSSYLSKDTKGYLRTARAMFEKGKLAPLT